MSDETDGATAGPADRVAVVYRVARGALLAGFAATVALTGVALALVAITGDPIAAETLPLRDLPGALGDADPGAWAQLAILAIVLTPVLTTVAVIAGFARIGDRAYAGVSALVLVVLSLSIAIALIR